MRSWAAPSLWGSLPTAQELATHRRTFQQPLEGMDLLASGRSQAAHPLPKAFLEITIPSQALGFDSQRAQPLPYLMKRSQAQRSGLTCLFHLVSGRELGTEEKRQTGRCWPRSSSLPCGERKEREGAGEPGTRWTQPQEMRKPKYAGCPGSSDCQAPRPWPSPISDACGSCREQFPLPQGPVSWGTAQKLPR